jgi:hypothetical protein
MAEASPRGRGVEKVATPPRKVIPDELGPAGHLSTSPKVRAGGGYVFEEQGDRSGARMATGAPRTLRSVPPISAGHGQGGAHPHLGQYDLRPLLPCHLPSKPQRRHRAPTQRTTPLAR